jgi:hypothetical protein
MPHRPAAEGREPRHPEGFGASVRDRLRDFGRERRRHALVSIDEQNPVAGRQRQGVVILRAVAGKGVNGHQRALAARDRHRVIGALAVDDDTLVGEGDTVETVADMGGLVPGDDDGAQTRHRFFRSCDT